MSKKYSRNQSLINREQDSSSSETYWLNEFEKNLDKTAVQSRTVDNSLFNQINSIMNGKSKYPSVSAAVEDMMQRSGLKNHLDNIKNSKNNQDNLKTKSASEKPEFVKKVLEASNNNDWFSVGKYFGIYDKKQDNIKPAYQTIDNIRDWYDSSLKDFNVPKNMWLSYASGYSEGANLSENEKEKNLQEIQNILKSIQEKNAKLKSTRTKKANEELNEKQVYKAIDNIISTSKGRMPIIAIVLKLKDIFKDIPESFWEDRKLYEYISNLNLKEKSSTFLHDNNNDSVGKIEPFDTSDNDSNTDAFHSLMPATK